MSPKGKASRVLDALKYRGGLLIHLVEIQDCVCAEYFVAGAWVHRAVDYIFS
jgi:hypothetical protein